MTRLFQKHSKLVFIGWWVIRSSIPCPRCGVRGGGGARPSLTTSPFSQSGISVWGLHRLGTTLLIVHDVERAHPHIADFVNLVNQLERKNE